MIIETEGLRKSYGDLVAVDDVSFEVRRGEIFGLIGPNGAGKTTTMECVEGLRTPDAGSVRVLGLDPWRDAPDLQQRVGVPRKYRPCFELRFWSLRRCVPTLLTRRGVS